MIMIPFKANFLSLRFYLRIFKEIVMTDEISRPFTCLSTGSCVRAAPSGSWDFSNQLSRIRKEQFKKKKKSFLLRNIKM